MFHAGPSVVPYMLIDICIAIEDKVILSLEYIIPSTNPHLSIFSLFVETHTNVNQSHFLIFWQHTIGRTQRLMFEEKSLQICFLRSRLMASS